MVEPLPLPLSRASRLPPVPKAIDNSVPANHLSRTSHGGRTTSKLPNSPDSPSQYQYQKPYIPPISARSNYARNDPIRDLILSSSKSGASKKGKLRKRKSDKKKNT